MKKLLIICILIVSLVFISGCTGEEKTNTKISTESPSSEHVIDPTTLLKGYQSSGYRTLATNEMNSCIYDFSGGCDLDFDGKLYEGPLPSGQKRTGTYFRLSNKDNGVSMNIQIGESDSDSKFEDSFNSILNIHDGKILNDNYYNLETNLVGDYSYLVSLYSNEKVLDVLCFSHENYIVSMYSWGTKQSMDLHRTEMSKVAKKIKSQLD